MEIATPINQYVLRQFNIEDITMLYETKVQRAPKEVPGKHAEPQQTELSTNYDKNVEKTKVSDLDIIQLPNIIKDRENEYASIVLKCLKNPDLIKELSEMLCDRSLENFLLLSLQIHISDAAAENIYKCMLPKLCNTKYTTELTNVFVTAFSKDKKLFLKYILHDMIEETCPEYSLVSFVNRIDSCDKYLVLNAISDYKLSQAQFKKCIQSIYILYRDCKWSRKLEDFIHRHLNDYSKVGTNNIKYGNLLLLFLQKIDHFNFNYVRLVSKHNTKYQTLCESILVKLYNSLLAQMYEPGRL